MERRRFYVDSGDAPLSGRLQLRLYGVDSEPPELTEIDALSGDSGDQAEVSSHAAPSHPELPSFR